MHPIYDQIVEEALKHKGVTETSYNSSPIIDQWLGRVNRAPGNSWCVAYAWCVVDDAFAIKSLKNPIPVVAGVHLLVQKAKALGLWSKNPGVGYIYCIDHGVDAKGNKIGHCGVCTSLQGDFLNGIEGNSNREGSREGNCVTPKFRALTEITLGYVDPGALL
jgi:hypothetical protein